MSAAMGLSAKNGCNPSGKIVGGYTIGVSQHQNCNTTTNNCPTSRKKTLSTPKTIPRPIVKATCMANSETIATKAQPGKVLPSAKKAEKSPKIIEKFNKALSTTVVGKHKRGKLSFFNRLA